MIKESRKTWWKIDLVFLIVNNLNVDLHDKEKTEEKKQGKTMIRESRKT
jgi:hypothetical protein